MRTEVIEVEADSVEEARRLVESRMPDGHRAVSETIVVGDQSWTVRGIGETHEAAIETARSKIPAHAIIMAEAVLEDPDTWTITIDADSEALARAQAEAQLRRVDPGLETRNVKALSLKKPGRKGFLGIGRKLNRYSAEVISSAVVVVKYRFRVRIKVEAATDEEIVADKARRLIAVNELLAVEREEKIRSVCCVCKRTKDRIVADVAEMERMGASIVGNDLLGYCSECRVAFCAHDCYDDGWYGSCPRCKTHLAWTHFH
jgi:hypothetical protein